MKGAKGGSLTIENPPLAGEVIDIQNKKGGEK